MSEKYLVSGSGPGEIFYSGDPENWFFDPVIDLGPGINPNPCPADTTEEKTVLVWSKYWLEPVGEGNPVAVGECKLYDHENGTPGYCTIY